MGYDVHITRKDEWWDEEGPVIALDEWLAVVEADPDLRLDGFSEVPTPDGSILRAEVPGLTVWTAHPEAPDLVVWLHHGEGEIQARYPDDLTLAKMADLARQLGANVQGDEGENYDESGALVPAPGEVPPAPKKRRWFGRS